MVDRYCVSNDWTVAHVFICEQDKYLYMDSNLRCDYLWVDRYWVINRHDFDNMDCNECNCYFYKSRYDNSPFCSKLKQKIAVENSINHCFVKKYFFLVFSHRHFSTDSFSGTGPAARQVYDMGAEQR